MRKEFNEVKEGLWAGRTYDQEGNENWAEIETLLINLEAKIDEVEKRIECAVRSSQEANDSISIYTHLVDKGKKFKMDVRDHDSILRATNDVMIALNMNDTECIDNNWYNLFGSKEEPKPIAVGRIEYEFPEEVYTIGNADNTEIIGDVYESVFVKLDELGVIINESDEGFPGGSQANYVVKNNIFIDIVKKQQIDLSKVPIKNEAPTMLCQDKDKHDAVKDIIAKLKAIEVDGETMQYILDQVGMSDQIAKQLSNEIF